MDDFSTFLASRRSTRDFLPEPVPMELIEQIIEDGLTAPSWSNTRPFVVAIATGEVRDRLSEEFLRRWNAVKDFRGSGIFRKIGSIFRRYGFPTSNWLVVKKYHKDLLPRSRKIGKDLYAHM